MSTLFIRIWEPRCRAVAPRWTAVDRRLYSQNDVERFGSLSAAARARPLSWWRRLPGNSTNSPFAGSSDFFAFRHEADGTINYFTHPVATVQPTVLNNAGLVAGIHTTYTVSHRNVVPWIASNTTSDTIETAGYFHLEPRQTLHWRLRPDQPHRPLALPWVTRLG